MSNSNITAGVTLSCTRPRLARVSTILGAAIVCAATASPSVSFASGGPASASDLIPYWVNFVLYAGILTVLLRKPLRSGWEGRRSRIEAAVVAASQDLEGAESELKIEEQRGKSLEAEMQKAKADILAQAELEAAAAVADARERSARMLSQAADLLQGEGRSAESEYKAELLDRALVLSRERFEKGAYASKDHEYRASAIARAGRLLQ